MEMNSFDFFYFTGDAVIPDFLIDDLIIDFLFFLKSETLVPAADPGLKKE